MNTKAEAVQDFIFAANEFRREGDWIMLAPYGDFPNARGLQRITRADAENVANAYRSWLNIPQWVIGAPVFKGHPDHEAFRGQPGHTDTEAVGRVKGLEARVDGLFANVKWNDRGRALIENEAFSHPSVNWAMTRQGDGSWRPVRLKSVGLTNSPNIPVPAITMANDSSDRVGQANEGPQSMNEEQRKKIARRLGLAEDATVEQIESAIAERETSLANERTARQQAETNLTTEKNARQTAETNFANEKVAREQAQAKALRLQNKAASVLITAAMAAGKVLPAEKQQWETEFANATDFDATITKLEGLKPKANTTATSRTNNLGARNATGAERQQVIQDFVNERMTNHGEDYLTAYKAAMRAKPEFFANTESN